MVRWQATTLSGGDQSLKSYIVRIYRYEKKNPRRIVGVVEEPEVEGKRAFTSLDELWGILNPRAAKQEICMDKDNSESRQS